MSANIHEINQLKLVFDDFGKLPKQKRNHFKAEWSKFYSVWSYYDTKYNDLMKMITQRNYSLLTRYPDIKYETIKDLTRYDTDKIKNLCWALDAEGQKQHLGDARHIYRVKTLNRLRTILAGYFDLEKHFNCQRTEDNEIIKKFNYYTFYINRYTSEWYIYQGKQYKGQKFETKEIDLHWVFDADIKTQVKAYINVLRACKSGLTLDDAILKVVKGL